MRRSTFRTRRKIGHRQGTFSDGIRHDQASRIREVWVAAMLKADLADARQAWLDEASGPSDRRMRERADFLSVRNHAGQQLDFHALRHTCGAWLALAGNHPKVIQSVLRHSTIAIRMDTSGHLFPGQEADAIASLPRLFE